MEFFNINGTKMHVREVVADEQWQGIREGLVGTWRKNANRSLRILRDYVGDGSDILRVARVFNYLTGSAFRMGVIGNEQTDALRKFCARKYKRHVEEYGKG